MEFNNRTTACIFGGALKIKAYKIAAGLVNESTYDFLVEQTELGRGCVKIDREEEKKRLKLL